MEKSKVFRGYIVYHKEVPYGVTNNELYTPIQANAAKNGKITAYGGVYDDEGDNISEWNTVFAETTCLYWIWKHHPECKYVGFYQYRRRFDIQTEEQLEDIFKKHKAVAVWPLRFNAPIRWQYGACHSIKDLDRVEMIVKRLYPDYAESWDKYINNGCELHYSNGVVMAAKDFDAYCEWLFSILFEFKDEMGWNTPEDVRAYVEKEIKDCIRVNRNGKGSTADAVRYQTQIFGFLSERLFTLYLKHNYKRDDIYAIPYTKMEKCL